MKTKSTRALYFMPMPCEQQAAYIQKQALKGMQSENILEVAYRFLQCAQGEKNTFNEIVLDIFITIAYLAGIGILSRERSIAKKWLVLASLSLAMLNLLNIPPNLCNTFKYKKTKEECEAWLKQRMGETNMNYISQLPLCKTPALEFFLQTRGFFHQTDIPNSAKKHVKQNALLTTNKI